MADGRGRGLAVAVGVCLLLGACSGSDGASPTSVTTGGAAGEETAGDSAEAPDGLAYDVGECEVGPPLSQTATVTPGTPSDAESVDPAGVGLIIGHSNAAILGTQLVRRSTAFPWVNAGRSGEDSAAWAAGVPGTWDRADELLGRQGWTPQDVQVVFVQLSRKVPPGEEQDWAPIEAFVDDLAVVVDEIEQRYPDASLVFLSSRITGRYSHAGNREPSAYRHGLAAARFVEGYAGPLTLIDGPYLWDDGSCLREDGLALSEADLRPDDGVHPSDVGRVVLADRIHAYLSSHPASQPWYAPEGGSSDGATSPR